MENAWFATWFDTPYYHILYKNRDFSEAEFFIDNLINYLAPNKGDRFVDIACGKGRHAKYIHEKGMDVSAFDLSKESIDAASKMATQGLQFYVQDMRQIFRTNYFDYAVNLFTSFGYFQNDRDEQNAIFSAAKSLKKEGKFVIDFLNAPKVIRGLVPYEEKVIEGICFKISKTIEGQNVIKSINFEDKGQSYHFQESVKLLQLDDFKRYLSAAGLNIIDTFGNYALAPYSEESNRLIIVAQKNG